MAGIRRINDGLEFLKAEVEDNHIVIQSLQEKMDNIKAVIQKYEAGQQKFSSSFSAVDALELINKIVRG